MLAVTALAALAAAAGVSAAPGLSLKVTGPSAVNGLSNLHLTTTLTNTGDETLKILNDPRTVLKKMPTNTFSIVHEGSGARPLFSGAKVKYVLETAAKIGKEDAFSVLAPGASVELTHDMSAAYNFTNSGAGRYSFEPDTLFNIVNADGSIAPMHADLADAHVAHVDGVLAVPRGHALRRRATYNGCSSSEQTSLKSAASAGNSYASGAASYASAHTASTTRFTTWFGTYTSSRHSTVLSHYTKISSHDMTAYQFDCTCTESDTYAYTYPDEFGLVYLCGAFWQAPTTGTDSKGGTLVHESSHFNVNGATQDYAYGQSSAKSLAKSNPSEAVMNADNHEYFAENNPTQS